MWPGHHCTETCPHIRPGDQSLPTCVALETAVATHGKLFRPNRTVRSFPLILFQQPTRKYGCKQVRKMLICKAC